MFRVKQRKAKPWVIFLAVALFFFVFNAVVSYKTQPLSLQLTKEVFSADENVQVVVQGPDEGLTFELFNRDNESVDFPTTLVRHERSWSKSFVSFLARPVSAGLSRSTQRGTVVEIKKPREFKPGRYTLKVRRGDNRLLEQDLLWGVLAVNLNKSVYQAGETASLAFALLDDYGAPMCNGTLWAEMYAPDGTITELSTRDGTIRRNIPCGDTSPDAPDDYAAQYQTSLPGTYRIVLHGQLPQEKDGQGRMIVDIFYAVRDSPFVTERDGPTRIYPPNEYPLSIRLKSQRDWRGIVTEKVPKSFSVSQISDFGTVQTDREQHRISWYIELQADEEKVLTYYFQAPKVSPEFYLLGPIGLGSDFEEKRQWHIAADPQTQTTCAWTGATNNDWSTATNWDCGVVPDNSGCIGSTDGTCYYVSINNVTNNPVLLGSTNRTISSLIVGNTTTGASFTINSTGTLDIQNQGGTVAGFNVGAFSIGSASTTGTLNLNPSSAATCITTRSTANLGYVGSQGIVTSSNSNCTWDRTSLGAIITNAGTFSGTWSMTMSGSAGLTNSGTINMTGGTFTTGLTNPDINCSSTRANNKFYNVLARGTTTLTGSCMFVNNLTVNTLATLVTGTGTHEVTATGSNPITNNGTFTATSGNTWMFTGTGATTIPLLTYHHLELKPTSGSPTYSWADGTVTMNGNLTVGDGTNTLNMNVLGSSNPTVNVTGDFTTNAAATITSGVENLVFIVNGNVTGAGTLNITTGLLRQIVSVSKNFGTSSGSNIWTFSNLQFQRSSGTPTIITDSGGSGGITVNGTFTIDTSTTLDAGGRTWTLTGTGTPLILNGSLTASTSTMNFIGDSASTVTIAAATYNNLGIDTTSDVSAGNTYAISGTTTVNGALTIGHASSSNVDSFQICSSCTLNLAGSGTPLSIPRGSFAGNNFGATTVYKGTGATTVTGGGASYYNISFQPPSGSPTYNIASGVDATNNATIGDGTNAVTVDVNSGGTLSLSVGLTVNAQGILQGPGTVSVGANGTPSVTGAGTINMSGGSFTLRPVASSTTGSFGTTSGTNNWTFNNLEFSNGAATTLTYTTQTGGSGGITVNGTLRVGGASDGASQITVLDAGNRTWTIPGSGTPFVINSGNTLTPNSSTFNYIGSSATNVAAATYNNLGVGTTSDAGSAVTYSLSGNATVNSVLTIGNASSTNTDVFDIVGYTLTLAGSGTPLNKTSKGDFLASVIGGVAKYSGTSNTNITAETYRGISFQPSSGSPTYTLPGTNINCSPCTVGDGTNAVTVSTSTGTVFTASGVLTLNAQGTLSGSASNGIIIADNDFTGNGTVNLTGGTFRYRSTVASRNFGTTSGAQDWTFNNLQFESFYADGATFTTQTGGTGRIIVNGSLLLNTSGDTGPVTLDAGNRTWVLAGTGGNPLQLYASPAGSLTANTSTFNYTGEVTTTVTGATYYNFGVGTTSDVGTGATYTLGGNMTANGTVTVGNASSTNTDTLAGSSYTLNLLGSGTPLSITSKGAFSAGTGTVSYNNTSSATVPAATYNNLQFNPASGTPTYTLPSGTVTVSNNLSTTGSGNPTVTAETNDPTLDIDGSLTIGSGDTFVASSTGTFTLARNFTNNGTFTAGTGTLTLDSSGDSLISGGSTTFYKFTSATAGKTLKFQKATGTTPTFTFSNLLTLTGAAGSNITLRSDTSGSQWLANFSTAQSSVTYANIADAGCASGSADLRLDSTSTDSGNNGSCWAFNRAPNTPSSLAQTKTDATSIATGGWTNSRTVRFAATVSDPDASDTLYLCLEAKAVGTSFSNSENDCGSGVSYSGTALTATVNLTLTDSTEYHWQARVKDAQGLYSSWSSFGSNSESVLDFGVDTTSPTGGTVHDGTDTSTDSDFNDGSLTQFSANWTGFSATVSGVARYDYSIGTSAGATDVKSWTDNSTSTSVTATNLTLRTGAVYYFNVRAVDNAGNTSSVVSSDGLRVLPLPPVSGFSPASGSTTSSKTPIFSWTHPSDTSVRYELCLSTATDPATNCTLSYTSEAGQNSLTITQALSDETTYYWRVRSKDSLGTTSSWSVVQNFYVNTSLDPILSVVKTVGLNQTQSGALGFSLLPNDSLWSAFTKMVDAAGSEFFPTLLAQSNKTLVLARTSFVDSLFLELYKLLRQPSLSYILLGGLLASLIFGITLVRKPRRLFGLMLRHPSHSFDAIAIRQKDGTYQYSYADFKKKASLSKGTFLASFLLLFVKVMAVAYLSAFYVYQSYVAIGFNDDGAEVVPGDILTYRIDYNNTGDGAASSFVLTDALPDGIDYRSASLIINGQTKTDAADGDEAAYDQNSDSVTFTLGSVGEKGATGASGYVQFSARVAADVQADDVVTNSAAYTYSEQTVSETTNVVNNPVSDTVQDEPRSTIGYLVYNDADRDIKIDSNEKGIKGVRLKLYQEKNGNSTLERTGASADQLVQQAASDANGRYEFSKLSAGTYWVSVDETSLPKNYSLTTGNNPKQVVLGSDTADYQGASFGYALPTSFIGDEVYVDANRNRIRESGEAGLVDITVLLYQDTDGSSTFESDKDTLRQTATTNANGQYGFRQVGTGVYFVTPQSTSNLVENYTLSSASDVAIVEITTDSNQVYRLADFGYYPAETTVVPVSPVSPETPTGSSTEEGTTEESETQSDESAEEVSDQDVSPTPQSQVTLTQPKVVPRQYEVPPPTLAVVNSQNADSDGTLDVYQDEFVIQGTAPACSLVILYVRSEPVVKIAQADTNGQWSLAVRTSDLGEGQHTLLAQTDVGGQKSELSQVATINVYESGKSGKVALVIIINLIILFLVLLITSVIIVVRR